MIIHLETGAYFALAGVAADCWSVAAAGGTGTDVVEAVVLRYRADPEAVRADVDRFLAELQNHGLLEPSPQNAPPNGGAALPPTNGDDPPQYASPVVEKYDDLEELLMFDPVHEVDEAGWPVVRDDPDR